MLDKDSGDDDGCDVDDSASQVGEGQKGVISLPSKPCLAAMQTGVGLVPSCCLAFDFVCLVVALVLFASFLIGLRFVWHCVSVVSEYALLFAD